MFGGLNVSARYRRICNGFQMLACRFKMPEKSMPNNATYQLINDELMFDKNPRLNLASFVTTWMDLECDKLILQSLNKNYTDKDEYPVTTELQVWTLEFLILIWEICIPVHRAKQRPLKMDR